MLLDWKAVDAAIASLVMPHCYIIPYPTGIDASLQRGKDATHIFIINCLKGFIDNPKQGNMNCVNKVNNKLDLIIIFL